MIESLFPGACAAGIDVPFFDRGLVAVNAQAQTPLDASALREVAGFFAEALFVRAIVTTSNTGRSTATNVTVIPVDGYHDVKKPSTNIDIGKSDSGVYETRPGASSNSPKGAIINSPSFAVRIDPTGPVDPKLIQAAFLVVLVWCIAIAIGSFVGGPTK